MPENERECYLLVGGRISDYQLPSVEVSWFCDILGKECQPDPSVLQLQYWIKMAVRE